MIDTIKMTKCTGCKMCGDICPVNAISYEVNEQGFWYPVVDTDKCIKCEKCIKACPVSEECIQFEHSRTKVVYAAWATDDNVRRKSTSGGIYYELALWVINNGGYIVGSVYSDDFKSAYHTFANDMEGLDRIMGSKYFQSDTENIYKKVKELLALDKLVLFTGAPCQVSALKHFLNKDYENLLTVDFICKGVPSPLIHKKKIELYEQKKKVPVTRYGDKTKPYGWSNFGETIEFKNNSKHFISRWKDEINNCFVRKNLNVRESCYLCEFKNGENDSDLTIGDFWGITGVTERDMFYGVSAIVVNTEKGVEAMYNLNNDVVGYIYVEDTNINYPVLHHPSEKDYYLYRDLYGNEDRHGSVYVREACDVFKPSDNVTIYGHNMADGTMFAHLHRYKREDFFNSHSIIYFDTLYERHAYQVVCVFRTSGTYGVGFPFHLYDNFKDEAEFKEFISTARDLAIFDSGISVEYGDKFICLSTCEDWPIKNGRLVVLAVRIA